MPTTSLIIDESKFYGRDGDKEKIIQILQSPKTIMSVISILGMGGLGKTTLAQLVFNDKGVKDHFELKAWVCVSDEFDVFQITKKILLALGCSIDDSNDVNLYQLKLKDTIEGKKFFIVLDDVWNENREIWESLQAPFNYGAPGSRILVTTGNEKVALVMGSTHVHSLKQLEDEDCWKLFAKFAFTNRYNNTNPNLVSIGREIVKKCGGCLLMIGIRF